MGSRAAVVIGINKTGGLVPLRAAVSGAKQVGEWLRREGFEVTCLVDDERPVAISDVKNAVKTFVDRGTILQLVVYFAGHGYLNGTAELWLLSGAPDDPDEAIDQTTSSELARSCGVPNVVFISDACRSVPPSVTGARVWGSSIFPNRQDNHVDVEVDRFFAAKPGDPALEMATDEARKAYAGLFTEILQLLHRDPSQDLIRLVRIDGSDTIVVPCRRIKEVLPELVNEAAQERSIQLRQKPQLRLECGEDSFIARAIFTKSLNRRDDARNGNATHASKRGMQGRRRTASRTTARTSNYKDQSGYLPEVSAVLKSDPDAMDAVDRVVAADQIGSFETQAGVQVTGATVVWTYAVGMEAEIQSTQATDAALVRLHGRPRFSSPVRPGSVILQFSDHTGTVLAGLPGYVASVTVENGRVINISYVPSKNAPYWPQYQVDQARVEHLRAVAAVAAKNGVLAVDRKDAKRFADLVRGSKRLDPTLGIYAALAYADVGLKNQVNSVQDHMRQDLSTDLFDVALLAGTMSEYPMHALGQVQPSPEAPRESPPLVPFSPMLSQTWSFLRARGIDLPPFLGEIGRYRIPALWTTFDPTAMQLLRDAVQKGLLT